MLGMAVTLLLSDVYNSQSSPQTGKLSVHERILSVTGDVGFWPGPETNLNPPLPPVVNFTEFAANGIAAVC
jgi:hypothetical protein